MRPKYADQVAVTPAEARDDIVQRRADLVLVQRQDAPQYRARAGVLMLETLLSGNEQSGDDP